MANTKLPLKPSPPQWVTSEAQPLNGLDLLGLRIPVERIGQTVLAAVTTITPTIRYISLRAWIARRYALARLPNSWESFREFAGRVEAAVAFGNLLVDRRTGGLVGPEQGLAKLDSGDDPIQLEALVKQLALLAYAGPSDALKISFSEEGLEVPGLTAERGIILADGVESVIGKTKFAKQLRSDPSAAVFSRSSLAELGAAFPIGRPAGEERIALISCLFPSAANDSFLSYRLLLELAESGKRRPKPDDIFDLAVSGYADRGDAALSACVDGWLWYLVRDMLAACHEAALQAAVDALPDDVAESELASGFLERLLTDDTALEKPLRDLVLLPSGKKPLDQRLSVLADLVTKNTQMTAESAPRWRGKIQETSIIRGALNGGASSPALLPVAWLVASRRVGDLSGVPERIHDLLSYQGVWRIGLSEVLLPTLNEMLQRGISIREAAYELTLRTVSHHLNIAWGRLQSDPRRDVAVISADGNRWSRHNSFYAGRTASRLPQAIGWLAQLGLIDENGCTPDGLSILNDLRISAKAAGAK